MNWPTENEQPTNAYKSRPSASSPPSFFFFSASMASASAGAEVCSNGDEVVHYGGNGDQIIRSDGNNDGDEVLRSDGNGDEVIRSDGNSNGDDVLRSDGNDDKVIRSDGNDNEILCSGSNGDEIGDKMLVVEDDGKLPVRTKEDEQAAQSLVHLASLPIDSMNSSPFLPL